VGVVGPEVIESWRGSLSNAIAKRLRGVTEPVQNTQTKRGRFIYRLGHEDSVTKQTLYSNQAMVNNCKTEIMGEAVAGKMAYRTPTYFPGEELGYLLEKEATRIKIVEKKPNFNGLRRSVYVVDLIKKK